MRLSKTAWSILGIGIFILAFSTLGWVYLQQGREQAQLNDSLSVAEATLSMRILDRKDTESELAQLKDDLDELENKLTQATSLLDRTRVSFPESVESIEYDEELFNIADRWDLEIIKLTSTEPIDKEVESVVYSVASFMVTIEGEVDDILDFVSTIAGDEDFTSTTVEFVNVTIPEPLTEKEKGLLSQKRIEEMEKPSATIKLDIYGYRGE